MRNSAINNHNFDLDDKSNVSSYLTFYLADKIFAVELLRVKEILEYDEVSQIPKMPDFVRGAINLRGKIIPVVELSLRLGYEETEITRRACIIVVELFVKNNPLSVGILVNSVHQVIDLDSEQTESAPSFGGNLNTDYIQSMGKIDNKFVVILDINKVLSMSDLGNLSSSVHEVD